jgi:excisionase family DNA binding protein
MEDFEDWGEVRLSEEQEEALREALWIGEEWQRNQKPERVKNGGQFFEKLMSVEEVADALRIAPQTLRNWVALRRVPFIRIGGKTRFRWKSVEAWLARKEFQQWQ